MTSDLEIIYDRFAYVYNHLKEKYRRKPGSLSSQEDDFLVSAHNLYVLEYHKDFPDTEKKNGGDEKRTPQYDNPNSKLTLEKDGFTEDDFIFDPPKKEESIDDKFSPWEDGLN